MSEQSTLDTGSNVGAQAKGMLALAEQRLVKDYPFHARFVAAWRTQGTDAVPTAAVTVRDGTIWLVYNPRFVTSCTLPELEGVLHHEVNHLLFGHVFDDPAQFADQEALLIAQEVTVNEWVPEPLPGRPITLDQYPELPPNEDTHTRYHRLAQPTDPDARKTPTAGPKKRTRGRKTTPSVPKTDSLVPKTSPVEPKKPARSQPLDDHSLWAEAQAAGLLGRLAIRGAIGEALEGLSPEQWKRLPVILRQQITRVCSSGEPGNLAELLPRPLAGTATIDWRQALRAYLRRATARQPAFHRQPRRFPELVGIVPGQVHRPEKARVMAVIDTSGSIDAAALEQISAELGRMSRVHDVTVVECDATVSAVYPWTGPLKAVRGRGGTDLRPPFQPDMLRKVRPDVVVYFTDGAGPAPTRRPPVPVVWCLTHAGTRPARWGREIRIDAPEKLRR